METSEAAPTTQARPKPPLWVRLTIGSNPVLTLVRIIVLVVAAFVISKYVLLPIRVTGESMLPTLKNGQVKFVYRLAYLFHPPRRGDIVAAQFAGPKILLLKRVIGMPGETVQISRGVIFIDDQEIEEPYAHGKIPWAFKRQRLEPKQYFVIGDNRAISDLALKYEFQIVGKVVF